jgi:heat shock protein HtpX
LPSSQGINLEPGHQILRRIRASRIHKDDDAELFNVAEEIAVAAGIPVPKVFLIHDPAANAMATGFDPEHASIAVTSGLRKILNRDELQAVIAHEISHIRKPAVRLSFRYQSEGLHRPLQHGL